MSVSETMLAQEKVVDARFNELLATNPVQAQAVATLGIYHAINTAVRMLAHTADELDNIT